jgi:hypothetical protein
LKPKNERNKTASDSEHKDAVRPVHPSDCPGEVYCFCFEMSFKEVEDERLVIIRREREVIC